MRVVRQEREDEDQRCRQSLVPIRRQRKPDRAEPDPAGKNIGHNPAHKKRDGCKKRDCNDDTKRVEGSAAARAQHQFTDPKHQKTRAERLGKYNCPKRWRERGGANKQTITNETIRRHNKVNRCPKIGS